MSYDTKTKTHFWLIATYQHGWLYLEAQAKRWRFKFVAHAGDKHYSLWSPRPWGDHDNDVMRRADDIVRRNEAKFNVRQSSL